MPAWIVITPEDLEHYQVAAIIKAARERALGDGQADPFIEAMQSVAARIRAEVQGCPRNRVSATAHAIPPDLKTVACHLLIEAMQTRIPGLEITEEQRELIKDGRRYLERVARCEVPIAAPDNPLQPSAVQQHGGIQVVTKSPQTATRKQLSGL